MSQRMPNCLLLASPPTFHWPIIKIKLWLSIELVIVSIPIYGSFGVFATYVEGYLGLKESK